MGRVTLSRPQPMRLSALLLSLATSTGLLVAPMAAAAETAAPAKPAARVEFAPTVGGTLQPGNALVVTGTITNESTAELAAGTATVYLDRNPITSRDSLNDWIDGTDDVPTSKLGSQLVSVDTPAVSPGRTATLTITVPEPNIGL